MDINKAKGFTLIELLITVAVIGVIAAIATPLYQQYSVRTHRTELQTSMVLISQKLAAYKMVNNDYKTVLTNPSIYGPAVFPQSGTALYNLALDTTSVAGSWTLTATPRTGTSQVGNGAVLLNDQGWRCWTKTTTPCTLSATTKWDDH